MISIVEKNLFDSKANFLVHQVNCQGVMGSGIALQVAKKYPHVDKEYRSYVYHNKKIKKNILGTVQYVPIDVWALGLVNTIKNDRVEAYDQHYQYIVNLFGQDIYGSGLQTNLNAFKKGMMDIKYKAENIGASVAMPFRIGSCRGGADWNDIYKIIKNVFDNSNVGVEICKYNLN